MSDSKNIISSRMRLAIQRLDMLFPLVARVHGDIHLELIEASTIYTELKTVLKTGGAYEVLLERLQTVTKGCSIPPDACPAYRKTYRTLAWITKRLKQAQG